MTPLRNPTNPLRLMRIPRRTPRKTSITKRAPQLPHLPRPLPLMPYNIALVGEFPAVAARVPAAEVGVWVFAVEGTAGAGAGGG